MPRNMQQWAAELIAAPQKDSFPVLSFPAIQMMGITVAELIASSDAQAKGMKCIADACKTCGSVSLMDLSVEAEAFGSKISVADDEVPTVVGTILKEAEDADALVVPSVGAGRTGLYIEAIEKACMQITDRPVFAGVIGPYSLAGRLMGMTDIMINCYEEPEMVETTLEKATTFLIAYAKAYKAVGANGIVMAEPAAGLLSAKMMWEFSGKYVKRLVDAVQDETFAVIYHNCGNSVPNLIAELTAIGAVGYHFGNAVSMQDMVEKMPASVLVMGNVDPAKQFRFGTPESVREATLSVMQACRSHPNFVISSGCDIPPASDWNNIRAFFEAVDAFYRSK